MSIKFWFWMQAALAAMNLFFIIAAPSPLNVIAFVACAGSAAWNYKLIDGDIF